MPNNPHGYRYNPDPSRWGVTGSNWYEDPDAQHAMNDYGAAVSGTPLEDRPPFAVADWRTADAQPTHPSWSCAGCDKHPELAAEPERVADPEPVADPWSAGGGWLGQHADGCRTNDPNCTGQCGG
jgi:hypothetical protein